VSAVLGVVELDQGADSDPDVGSSGTNAGDDVSVTKWTFSAVASVSYFGSAFSAIARFPRVAVRNRLCDDTRFAWKFAIVKLGLETFRRKTHNFLRSARSGRNVPRYRKRAGFCRLSVWPGHASRAIGARRKHPMDKLTEYLQTAEAAEYLGVAQNTIRKWAARGELPVHRNPANGYRLFKREDLVKFLARVAKPVPQKTK
jgi:excisionase family DNA binding protein